MDAGLARLGYTDLWIASGVLTRDVLQEQISNIEKLSADQNTEHYRWAVFSNYLNGLEKATPAQFASLVEISNSELETTLGETCFHALAYCNGLNDAQFEDLKAYCRSVAFIKIWRRRHLIRCLQAETTTETIQQAIESKDSTVHRWMLDHMRLEKSHVLMLADIGASKAVRNLAKVELKRKANLAL